MVGRATAAWSVSAAAVAASVAMIAVLAGIATPRSTLEAPAPTVLTRTLTPAPVDITPRPTAMNAQSHELVQVERDLMVNPPAYIATWAADPVVSATVLGNRDGKLVFGTLTADDKVSIGIYDPEKSETQGRTVSYDEFLASGLSIDRGSWSVTWSSDGTVVFENL